MKKQISYLKTGLQIIGIALLLASSACTKHSSTPSVTQPPTNPVSTFNITFNNKTISVVSSTSNPTPIVGITQTDAGGLCNCLSYGQVFDATLSVDDTKISGTLAAFKTNLSTAVGTYKIGNAAYITNSEITDITDGGKVYMNVQDTTASTITISVSNSTEVKGTFNLQLTYNGVTYPATGNFDYNH